MSYIMKVKRKMEKDLMRSRKWSLKDKIPVPPRKPLPLEDVPMWKTLPYDAKHPIPKYLKKGVMLAREELGKSLYPTFPSKDFDLSQSPNTEKSTYNSLHDPHLRHYFQSALRFKSLVRRGLITIDGKVKSRLQEFNQYRMYLYHLWAMQVNQLSRTQMLEEEKRLESLLKAHESEDSLFSDVVQKYDKINVEDFLEEAASKIFQNKKIIAEHGFSPFIRSIIQWKIYQEKLQKQFRKNYPAVREWLREQTKHYRQLMEKKLNAHRNRERKLQSRWEKICESSRVRLEKELRLQEEEKERRGNLSEQRYRRAKSLWTKNEQEILSRKKTTFNSFKSLFPSGGLKSDKWKFAESEITPYHKVPTEGSIAESVKDISLVSYGIASSSESCNTIISSSFTNENYTGKRKESNRMDEVKRIKRTSDTDYGIPPDFSDFCTDVRKVIDENVQHQKRIKIDKSETSSDEDYYLQREGKQYLDISKIKGEYKILSELRKNPEYEMFKRGIAEGSDSQSSENLDDEIPKVSVYESSRPRKKISEILRKQGSNWSKTKQHEMLTRKGLGSQSSEMLGFEITQVSDSESSSPIEKNSENLKKCISKDKLNLSKTKQPEKFKREIKEVLDTESCEILDGEITQISDFTSSRSKKYSENLESCLNKKDSNWPKTKRHGMSKRIREGLDSQSCEMLDVEIIQASDSTPSSPTERNARKSISKKDLPWLRSKQHEMVKWGTIEGLDSQPTEMLDVEVTPAPVSETSSPQEKFSVNELKDKHREMFKRGTTKGLDSHLSEMLDVEITQVSDSTSSSSKEKISGFLKKIVSKEDPNCPKTKPHQMLKRGTTEESDSQSSEVLDVEITQVSDSASSSPSENFSEINLKRAVSKEESNLSKDKQHEMVKRETMEGLDSQPTEMIDVEVTSAPVPTPANSRKTISENLNKRKIIIQKICKEKSNLSKVMQHDLFKGKAKEVLDTQSGKTQVADSEQNSSWGTFSENGKMGISKEEFDSSKAKSSPKKERKRIKRTDDYEVISSRKDVLLKDTTLSESEDSIKKDKIFNEISKEDEFVELSETMKDKNATALHFPPVTGIKQPPLGPDYPSKLVKFLYGLPEIRDNDEPRNSYSFQDKSPNIVPIDFKKVKDTENVKSPTESLRTDMADILDGFEYKEYTNVWKTLEKSINDTKRKELENLELQNEKIIAQRREKLWRGFCEIRMQSLSTLGTPQTFSSEKITEENKIDDYSELQRDENEAVYISRDTDAIERCIRKKHLSWKIDHALLSSTQIKPTKISKRDRDNDSPQDEISENVTSKVVDCRHLKNFFFNDRYKTNVPQHLEQIELEGFTKGSNGNLYSTHKRDGNLGSTYFQNEKKMLRSKFLDLFLSSRNAPSTTITNVKSHPGVKFNDFKSSEGSATQITPSVNVKDFKTPAGYSNSYNEHTDAADYSEVASESELKLEALPNMVTTKLIKERNLDSHFRAYDTGPKIKGIFSEGKYNKIIKQEMYDSFIPKIQFQTKSELKELPNRNTRDMNEDESMKLGCDNGERVKHTSNFENQINVETNECFETLGEDKTKNEEVQPSKSATKITMKDNSDHEDKLKDVAIKIIAKQEECVSGLTEAELEKSSGSNISDVGNKKIIDSKDKQITGIHKDKKNYIEDYSTLPGSYPTETPQISGKNERYTTSTDLENCATQNIRHLTQSHKGEIVPQKISWYSEKETSKEKIDTKENDSVTDLKELDIREFKTFNVPQDAREETTNLPSVADREAVRLDTEIFSNKHNSSNIKSTESDKNDISETYDELEGTTGLRADVTVNTLEEEKILDDDKWLCNIINESDKNDVSETCDELEGTTSLRADVTVNTLEEEKLLDDDKWLCNIINESDKNDVSETCGELEGTTGLRADATVNTLEEEKLLDDDKWLYNIIDEYDKNDIRPKTLFFGELEVEKKPDIYSDNFETNDIEIGIDSKKPDSRKQHSIIKTGMTVLSDIIATEKDNSPVDPKSEHELIEKTVKKLPINGIRIKEHVNYKQLETSEEQFVDPNHKPIHLNKEVPSAHEHLREFSLNMYNSFKDIQEIVSTENISFLYSSAKHFNSVPQDLNGASVKYLLLNFDSEKNKTPRDKHIKNDKNVISDHSIQKLRNEAPIKSKTIREENFINVSEVRHFDASDKSERVVCIRPTRMVSNIQRKKTEDNSSDTWSSTFSSKDTRKNIEFTVTVFLNKLIDAGKAIRYEAVKRDLDDILINLKIDKLDFHFTTLLSNSEYFKLGQNAIENVSDNDSQFYQIQSDSTSIAQNNLQMESVENVKVSYFDLEQREASLDSVSNFIFPKGIEQREYLRPENNHFQRLKTSLTPSFTNIVIKNPAVTESCESKKISNYLINKEDKLKDENVSEIMTTAEETYKPSLEVVASIQPEQHKIKVHQINLKDRPSFFPMNFKYNTLHESIIPTTHFTLCDSGCTKSAVSETSTYDFVLKSQKDDNSDYIFPQSSDHKFKSDNYRVIMQPKITDLVKHKEPVEPRIVDIGKDGAKSKKVECSEFNLESSHDFQVIPCNKNVFQERTFTLDDGNFTNTNSISVNFKLSKPSISAVNDENYQISDEENVKLFLSECISDIIQKCLKDESCRVTAEVKYGSNENVSSIQDKLGELKYVPCEHHERLPEYISNKKVLSLPTVSPKMDLAKLTQDEDISDYDSVNQVESCEENKSTTSEAGYESDDISEISVDVRGRLVNLQDVVSEKSDFSSNQEETYSNNEDKLIYNSVQNKKANKRNLCSLEKFSETSDSQEETNAMEKIQDSESDILKRQGNSVSKKKNRFFRKIVNPFLKRTVGGSKKDRLESRSVKNSDIFITQDVETFSENPISWRNEQNYEKSESESHLHATKLTNKITHPKSEMSVNQEKAFKRQSYHILQPEEYSLSESEMYEPSNHSINILKARVNNAKIKRMASERMQRLKNYFKRSDIESNFMNAETGSE